MKKRTQDLAPHANPTLLIVEDEESTCTQLRWALGNEYEVLLAKDRESALETYRLRRPSLVLLDLRLPPHMDAPTEGLAALAAIRRIDPQARVIVVSGHTDRETARQAVGQGACDFLCKPVQMEELKFLLHRCHIVADLERDYQSLRTRRAGELLHGLQGTSPAMQEVFRSIPKVAETDAPVLILGEAGTGKEMAARAIHGLSGRAAAPFVVINCGSIPKDHLDSELFGLDTRAFTGAHFDRPGRIELADGGTVYLNEVDALPLEQQVKLLRFLQEQAVERVGGHRPIRIDARVMAATKANLERVMATGKFREDLYYRLAVVILRMPSLRERKEDVRLLAKSLLARFSAQYSKPDLRLEPKALRSLERYSWPGNVRELENCLRRAVILSETDMIQEAHLDLPTSPAFADARRLKEARHETEREMIVQALRRHHGKIAPAAKELGISRPAFYAMMGRLRIERPCAPKSKPHPNK